jgi:hypothetical protein
MGQESQQDNSRNQGMEINSLVNGEAENAMQNTADENFPVQMNGHYSRNVNVDPSVNNGIPQSCRIWSKVISHVCQLIVTPFLAFSNKT